MQTRRILCIESRSAVIELPLELWQVIMYFALNTLKWWNTLETLLCISKTFRGILLQCAKQELQNIIPLKSDFFTNLVNSDWIAHVKSKLAYKLRSKMIAIYDKGYASSIYNVRIQMMDQAEKPIYCRDLIMYTENREYFMAYIRTQNQYMLTKCFLALVPNLIAFIREKDIQSCILINNEADEIATGDDDHIPQVDLV